jgi:outer membrane protein OmpA-like peptidoglycan-associated protein
MMRRLLMVGLSCFLLRVAGAEAQDSGLIQDPAPAPPSYVVLFDPESTNLESHAEQVLAQVVADYGEYQPPLIYVDGYYDRHGGEEHALQMSKAIAETVRGYLVERGVPTSTIEVAWHGVDSPMVPPGDAPERFSRSVDVRFSATPNPYRQ